MIDLTGRVAIVTGAGAGLGRAHAHLLARRGARVVVNDLGSSADKVAAEINTAGGKALAAQGSVTDLQAMLDMAETARFMFDRIDILVNNAGVVRDKTFAKLEMDDFRAIVDVHLIGAVNCTKAVWEIMRGQGYGRIVMTTSCSGLYGNFGQSNYGAAKMALVGLMQTLALEGAKYDIRVNCLAPTAATAMTAEVLPPERLARLDPALVSPGMLALVAPNAPSRAILCAGAGGFELAHITLTKGLYLEDPETAAEALLARWAELSDRTDEIVPENALAQGDLELRKAGLVA